MVAKLLAVDSKKGVHTVIDGVYLELKVQSTDTLVYYSNGKYTVCRYISYWKRLISIAMLGHVSLLEGNLP